MKQWRGPLTMLGVLVALGAYVHFRERQPVRENPLLLSFEPKEVQEINLKTTKTADDIALKRNGDNWRLVKPIECAADAQSIETLLNTTKEILQSGGDFQAKNLKPYGLDKPKVLFTAKMKNGKTAGLALGDKLPDNVSVYAVRPGSKHVYVVSGSVFDNADKSPDDLRDKTAVHFDREQVTGLKLVYGDKTIDVSKETEMQWTLKSPMKAPADAVAIDGFLNNVKGFKATKFIAEKMDEAKTYGLDKPQLKLELPQRKNEPIGLLIGTKAKEDPSAVYAKAINAPQVFLLTDSTLTQLKKELSDFRSKNVLALETEKVTRLQIASANGDLDLERSSSGASATWKLQKPGQFPADKVKVDSVLSTINNMKATEFIDHPAADAEYGFDKPQSKLTVWLEGGKSPYRTLVVGKKLSNPDAMFVKLASESTVYKVTWSQSDDDNLKLKVSAVREKLIAKFEKDKAEKITLKPADGKSIVLERSGKDDWKITAPQKVDANKLKMDSLLFTASDLRGDDWVEDDPKDLTKYGLDKPRMDVEVKVKGADTQRFAIGKKTDAGDKAYVLAKGKVSSVYMKSEFGLTDLMKDFAELRKP